MTSPQYNQPSTQGTFMTGDGYVNVKETQWHDVGHHKNHTARENGVNILIPYGSNTF